MTTLLLALLAVAASFAAGFYAGMKNAKSSKAQAIKAAVDSLKK